MTNRFSLQGKGQTRVSWKNRKKIYVASWNQVLNNDKKNDDHDSDSWWNIGVDWSSDGDNESGDENKEFSLVKPYSKKIDPRSHTLFVVVANKILTFTIGRSYRYCFN